MFWESPFGVGGSGGASASETVYVPTLTTGDSGTNNRAAIQAVVDAVATGGVPARILISEPGTYLVAGGSTGYYSTGKGCIVLSSMPAGSIFEIGPGVTLKLPDSSMTGTTLWYDMFVADAASLDITIQIDGTVDLNSTNQPGWSHGYRQLDGSCGVRVSCTVGAFTRVRVRGSGTIKNTFANSIHCFGESTAPTFGGTVEYDGLTFENFGEGPTADVCNRFTATNLKLNFNDNLNGDVLESANSNDVVIALCRGRHVSGTQSPAGGGFIDVGGSKRVRIVACDGADSPLGFQAQTTTNAGLGTRRVEYLDIDGLRLRNVHFTGYFANEGYSNVRGLDLESDLDGLLFQRTIAYDLQKHTFYGPRVTGNAPVVIQGTTEISIVDPDIVGVASALAPERHATYTGTPTIRLHGGRVYSSGAYGLLINSANLGTYTPIIKVSGGTSITGGAGSLFKTGTGASFSATDLDSVIFDSLTTGRSNSLSVVSSVNAAATGATSLINTPSGFTPVVDAVILTVQTFSGGSGNVTLSVGTAAGSVIDIVPSTTVTLTAVGQRIILPLNSTAGIASGAGVSLSITAAMSGTCTFTLECRGRFLGS